MFKKFATTMILILCVMSQVTFAQRSAAAQAVRPNPKQFYSSVGLVRQVIAEKINGESEDGYFFEDQSGNYFPLKGKFDFDLYRNKVVTVQGSITDRTKVITASSLESFEKIEPKRQMRPETLPFGQTDYDLGTKEGQSSFELLGNGINLPSQTTGIRPTIFVPVTFTNNATLPLTKAELQSRIHTGLNTVNDYFLEASFRKFGLASVVMDPVAIPMTDVNCQQNMFSTWKQAALQQLPPEVVESSNNFVFFAPQIVGCDLQAVSTVGNKGVNASDQFAWIQLIPNFVNQMSSFRTAVVHEYAHQLGIQHPAGITPSGVVTIGADLADIAIGSIRYPNPFHRLTLGWYPISTKITIINGGPGSYNLTLKPIISMINKQGSRLILIPRYSANGASLGDMKMIEIRSDAGPQHPFESFPDVFGLYKTGLSIRSGSLDLSIGENRSYLHNFAQFDPTDPLFAPLPVGRQFADSSDGVTISYNSFSIMGGAKLNVTTTRSPGL